jgi:hypothetical protein
MADSRALVRVALDVVLHARIQAIEETLRRSWSDKISPEWGHTAVPLCRSQP